MKVDNIGRQERSRKSNLKLFFLTLFLIQIIMVNTSCSNFFCSSGNLHLIEKDKESGFALYRSGWPDENLIKEYCKLGIEEIMVLSGNAVEYEGKYKDACPPLKVIYNYTQDASTSLDDSFLLLFDQWILKSKSSGKKIGIRCDCGSHRTGRLAAYYQMKYQNLTVDDAKAILTKHGKWMLFFPQIYSQVDALSERLNNRHQ